MRWSTLSHADGSVKCLGGVGGVGAKGEFSVHAHMQVLGTCLLRQHVTPCRRGFQQGARVENKATR